MIPLLVICSVFNDKDNIKRHLQSIPQYIHQETWDGRYKDFDYPCDLSDDGTREVVNTFYNAKLIDAGNLTEVEKREKAWKSFDPNSYKFMMVIDSDEYFKGDWQDFLIDLDEMYEKYYDPVKPICFGIRVMNPSTGEYDPRPRIWMNGQNVVYGPRHNEYKSKIDNSPLYFSHIIESMKIEHNYKLRYPSYNDLRIKYQEKLATYDAAL